MQARPSFHFVYWICVGNNCSSHNCSAESNSRLLWFFFTVVCDWLTKLASLSQPMRNKTKPIVPRPHVFSRAWHRLLVLASDPDWFIVLCTFVIGQSSCFGFTTLDSKPLHCAYSPGLKYSIAHMLHIDISILAFAGCLSHEPSLMALAPTSLL